MYVINDDWCNAYAVCGGVAKVTRGGDTTVFESRDEAEKALEIVHNAGYVHAYIDAL